VKLQGACVQLLAIGGEGQTASLIDINGDRHSVCQSLSAFRFRRVTEILLHVMNVLFKVRLNAAFPLRSQAAREQHGEQNHDHNASNDEDSKQA
jgi:hypothetical protein